jgi:hypothetical protein
VSNQPLEVAERVRGVDYRRHGFGRGSAAREASPSSQR